MPTGRKTVAPKAPGARADFLHFFGEIATAAEHARRRIAAAGLQAGSSTLERLKRESVFDRFSRVMTEIEMGYTDRAAGWAAARKLAGDRRFFSSSWFADRKVRRQLGRDARRRGSEAVRRRIVEEVFPEAILVAYRNHMTAERRIRLGKDYLKDDAGRVLPRVPADLMVPDFFRWLRQRARRHAGALILGEDAARDGSHVEVFSVLTAEPSANTRALLSSVAARGVRLSVHEQRLLSLLAAGHDAAAIGAALGISTSAARMRKQRLKRKMRRRAS